MKERLRGVLGVAVACGLLFPGAVFAAAPSKGGLPALLTFTFKDLGGVKSWRAGGDTVIFIKSHGDQWYRADMAETCMKLDTSKGINFIVNTDPKTQEKINAIVVDRHICRVTSLKRAEASEVPAEKTSAAK